MVQYSMDTFDVMLQLAGQAGITTSSPKIGDALELSMKEHKKLRKDLKKPGQKIQVQVGDDEVAGAVVDHPVYDKERKRAKES